MGYSRAGFDVVGVDNRPQPNYPFEFHQDDALDVLRHLGDEMVGEVPPWGYRFAAIHASPPCQAYSVATRDKTGHPDLVAAVRDLLEETSLPYVIENVPGAPLIDPVTICGSSLGLRVRRHRLFEMNWPLIVPPCAHGQQGQPVGVYGEGSSSGQVRGRKADNEAEVLTVMGMPWANRKEATQAIPPAYTELIGHQLMQHIQASVAGAAS